MQATASEQAVALSAAALTPEAPFRRRLPTGHPPPEGERFDGRTLIHDVFRDAAGDIAVIGPPPANLEPWLREVVRRALPARCRIEYRADFRHFRMRIRGDADALELAERHVDAARLAVQPYLGARFDGRRVLTTLSKDNPLEWIADWAHYYAAAHGCDAVLLYDNGSTRYGVAEIGRALAAVPGLACVTVLSWPYHYGVQGGSNFCQFCMLEHARRRFLAGARSVVNADIDELATTRDGRSVFALAEASASGYLRVGARYVSNATRARPEARRHRDFACRDRDDPPSNFKWVAVPARCPDEAAWRVHHIHGMESDDALAALAEFQHFKGINTNWREPRWQPGEAGGAEPDAELARWLARVPWREVAR